jgi:hypothetical protein
LRQQKKNLLVTLKMDEEKYNLKKRIKMMRASVMVDFGCEP